jgi:hypothetical protein
MRTELMNLLKLNNNPVPSIYPDLRISQCGIKHVNEHYFVRIVCTALINN